MTQELVDLRTSILEGRYTDALIIIDELEGMSKQATLRNIESYLVRLMVHLIKNQVEQCLTNFWAASMSNSIVEIKRLNLKDNKTSYYVNADEWQFLLEEALELAIRPAIQEVLNGKFSRSRLSETIDRDRIILIANQLLSLTYDRSIKELEDLIDRNLTQLPGGKDWNLNNQE